MLDSGHILAANHAVLGHRAGAEEHVVELANVARPRHRREVLERHERGEDLDRRRGEVGDVLVARGHDRTGVGIDRLADFICESASDNASLSLRTVSRSSGLNVPPRLTWSGRRWSPMTIVTSSACSRPRCLRTSCGASAVSRMRRAIIPRSWSRSDSASAWP